MQGRARGSVQGQRAAPLLPAGVTVVGTPRSLALVLGFLGFTTVYGQLVMMPALTQIGRDFAVSVGAAGFLSAAYGLPGIALSLMLGPLSDRAGRRPFLIGGSLLMGACTLLGALAPSFGLLLAARIISGAGASAIFPNIAATIGDAVPYQQRSKAMSTVIAMQTIASLAGLPLAGVIAEAVSWRASLALTGMLAITATLVLLRFLPPDPPRGEPSGAGALLRSVLVNRSAVGGIVAGFLSTSYWIAWGTYIVVYFERVHGLSPGQAAVAAVANGLGALVGSVWGGRLGPRFGYKPMVVWTITGSAILLVALTGSSLPLPASLVLVFAASTLIGMRFANHTALMSEQMPEARGTLLAIAGSLQTAGIVAGATLGGFFVDGSGFGALGLASGALALLTAGVVAVFVRDGPLTAASSGDQSPLRAAR